VSEPLSFRSAASPSAESLEIPKWLTKASSPLDDLPLEHRRLIERIQAGVAPLQASSALDLLGRSGLTSDFDDLFRHAESLDLAVDVIAAIVLSRLLGGPLRAYLDGDAQVVLAALNELAGKSTEALRELGRVGQALAKLLHQPTARQVLRRVPDEESLERFAELPGLLRHIDESVERSAERIKHHLAQGPRGESVEASV